MESEELLFELICDPELKTTMQDSLFTDFVVIVGNTGGEMQYPLNLTLASIFSLKFREFLAKIKNHSTRIDRAYFPMVSSRDFKIVHSLLNRGKVLLIRDNMLGALKMASFFQIATLMNFLVDYVEKNEDYIDRMDLFLFAFEADSKYLYSLAKHRVTEMGEAPFFSDKIPRYFSEEALKRLLSK